MTRTRHSTLLSGLAALALAAACGQASAASRVALVIGNASYAHAPVLANPPNDAADVGAAFGRLGFEVTRLASDQDVEFEAVPLELVQRAVERASKLRGW